MTSRDPARSNSWPQCA